MLADPPVLMFTAKTGNTMPRISTNINYGEQSLLAVLTKTLTNQPVHCTSILIILKNCRGWQLQCIYV